MNIYSYIKHLCFKDLISNLQNKYKEDIEKNLSTKIKKRINRWKKFE